MIQHKKTWNLNSITFYYDLVIVSCLEVFQLKRYKEVQVKILKVLKLKNYCVKVETNVLSIDVIT